ncbi:glycosyltransferase family 4 protein [Patescibacteria group bacterium]|nr:glycosyltransferase family 4 protein [Patescibacteria group bacterium]MBU4099165.1 glycosyltransferase family 4 protein [Patescibacteria group bacterium]
MNIVFLDFDDIKNPLLAAGQAIATYEVGKIMVKMGHKITVISSRFPEFKDRKDQGIYYKHIGLGSSSIKLNNLIYILSLPFIVTKIKADIIIECFTPPISTLFTPLWTSIPVVALPSSFEADHFSKKYHLPFTWIEKFGSKFYKYFLPYSPYTDEKMKKMNPRIISKIVPEGVSREFFKIKKEPAEHILFLGRMDINQKGIDLLLKAYKKIIDRIQYPLIIAGNGPDEKKVSQIILQSGLEKKVFMIGAAYGRKKMKILAKSLFVAFPSRHETFSCFALEALASGLPLVAFDIPGLSWTDKKSTIKAKNFDVNDYAKILLRTSKNKHINIISKNARTFARKYTWKKVALDFEAFFKKIMDYQL